MNLSKYKKAWCLWPTEAIDIFRLDRINLHVVKPFPIYLYDGYWLREERILQIESDTEYTLKDAVDNGHHFGENSEGILTNIPHYENKNEADFHWRNTLELEKMFMQGRLAKINSELGNSKKNLCIFTTKARK